MKTINHILFLCLCLGTVSCFKIETSDPEKAYNYWSGSEVPSELKVINGKYYQSPHFSLEYEVYLEVACNERWWKEFVHQNGLKPDTMRLQMPLDSGFPDWFKPDKSFIVYSKNDRMDRSRFYVDLERNTCFIYDTVGM